MNNKCTTKCKYCELVVFVSNTLTRYKCMAQKNAPFVYPYINNCPYKNIEPEAQEV